MLDAVAAQHAVLRRNPGDREALADVRRGFHTLKGSGRMVGLTDLGDLAYEVERIHNRVLEEDRSVTPTVLALIAVAARDFRTWVDALHATRRVTADPAPIEAAVRAVEAELAGGPGGGPGGGGQPAAPKPLSVVPPSPPSASAPRLPDLELVELPELGASIDDVPIVAQDDEPPGETIDVMPASTSESHKPVLRVVAHNPQPAGAGFVPSARLPTLTLADAGWSDVPSAAMPAPADEDTIADKSPLHDPTTPASARRDADRSGCGGAGRRRGRHRGAVALAVEDPLRRGRAASAHARGRASSTAVRFARGAVRGDGARKPYAVRHSSRRRLSADRHHGPRRSSRRCWRCSSTARPCRRAAQPVIARAIAGLADFTARVRARFGFLSAHEREGEDIQRELEALRQETTAVDGEGEAADPSVAGGVATAERFDDELDQHRGHVDTFHPLAHAGDEVATTSLLHMVVPDAAPVVRPTTASRSGTTNSASPRTTSTVPMTRRRPSS